jgi:sulfur transfer protein SufE
MSATKNSMKAFDQGNVDNAKSMLQAVQRFAYGGLVPPQPEWFLSSEDADTQKRMQDQAKAYEDQAAAYNAAQQKYKTEVYDPYISQIEAYNRAIEVFNAGPRTSPFGMSVPTAPAPFSMTAPTLPFTEEQIKQTTADIQKRADEQYLGRATGLEVMLDPKKYNLGIRSVFDSPTRRFNQGGEATTDDFIKSNVSRGTSEVPQLDAEGRLIDENAEMRSESQRMLNRLKTAQQESYRRGKLPPGIQRAVTDVMSEDKPPLVRGKAIQTAGDVVGGLVGATPRDPTNPSEAYRLMQGFTGAYLPTAPVAKTGQAAGMAIRQPRATMSAARQSLEELGDIPTALAQPNQLGAQAGMVRLGSKEPKSIFTPLPSPDAPFVGRLDTFVSELPGAVRKDQFLASLEGKFRSYEIGRAEEALRDLSGDAKLSPVELLNRIKQRYDPSYYRTQVVEPQKDKFYYSMDNIYQGPTKDEFPLGVIHLIQSDNPQSVSKNINKKLQTLVDRTFGGMLTPEELVETRSTLSDLFGTLSSADKRRLAGAWTPYARINKAADGFEEVSHYLLYPSLNKNFTDVLYKYSLASPEIRNAELTKVMQGLAKTAENRYGIQGIEPYLPKFIEEHLGLTSEAGAYDAVRNLINERRKELSRQVNEASRGFRSTLRDLMEKEGKSYRGQHATLGNEADPIAFSRFSEHVTDIPGLGKTKGIYVNELQSDRLDDIRTKGPYGGSAQKDLVTRLLPLKEQQAKLLEQFIKMKSRGATYDQLSAASKQLDDLDEKIEKTTKRVREGTYSLRESFPNMEESPQVIQQLMAKNVISAAINRGVNFVAFPGAESKQAQLYEKLPYNLKQVVKDLGPGFEIRPISLTKPDGQEVSHTAVVWGPEAADRIKQKGVPFKDGGEVNVPRETSTSKQQLDKLAQVSKRKKA